MRQRDDAAFENDISLMQSRCFTNSSLPEIAHGGIHVYTSNHEVDAHNNKVLSEMNSEGALSKAVDSRYSW